MCSTGPFQYRWLKGYIYSSCYYHHQLGSIHLSHCYIFPWLCAWDVCYIIFCHLLHKHSGKTGNLFSFIIIVQFMMSANSWIRFALQIILVCLYSTPSHYHHCAKWSEDIELLKCLSDIFCRVCKIKHILSVIHYTICGAVCFRFSHFPHDDWENIYTLSYYHHQIGSMNYYPLFRVRSWKNGVRCLSFYILIVVHTEYYCSMCQAKMHITLIC